MGFDIIHGHKYVRAYKSLPYRCAGITIITIIIIIIIMSGSAALTGSSRR
jgi:t-SNARE complex subunit (syntaxin)